MREINVKAVEEFLSNACGTIACDAPADIVAAMQAGAAQETQPRCRQAMQMLLQNEQIAHDEQIPICQDTGMAVVWLTVGQEVHLTGGSLSEAVRRGVAAGYTRHYLRASVVDDPLFERHNTGDNTPCILYCSIVPGDQLSIELMAKGFGSENMSQIRMLKPAEGLAGVKKFVLDTIQQAGPNACPPMIVGVGIGGTFDYAAEMAKHALLRPLTSVNPDPRYAKLEAELLQEANQLKVGPLGLHGVTTALRVLIESYPTHIAGLPCAVNICCHVCRHAKAVI